MSKFAGLVGYAAGQTETAPGIWEPKYDERAMRGDLIRNTLSMIEQNQKTDEISLDNRISILGDQFAFNNFSNIRYVYHLGVKWKVKSVEVQRPRLILTVGGVWNE